MRKGIRELDIIFPPTALNGDEITWPLFFLGGPIQGGGQWQQRAIGFLLERLSNFTVAIPGPETIDRTVFASRIRYKDESGSFPRRLHWERWYMQKASIGGCLIFWLPQESGENPRSDGSPYARDTYGELGEWRGRMGFEKGIQLSLGVEYGFPGRSVIGANFEAALGDTFEMHSSLRDTVESAILRVRDSTGRLFYDESRAPISCQYERGFRYGLEGSKLRPMPNFSSLVNAIAHFEEDDVRKSYRMGMADGTNAGCKR